MRLAHIFIQNLHFLIAMINHILASDLSTEKLLGEKESVSQEEIRDG